MRNWLYTVLPVVCCALLLQSVLAADSLPEHSEQAVLKKALYQTLLGKEDALWELQARYSQNAALHDDLTLLGFSAMVSRADSHSLAEKVSQLSLHNPSPELKQRARYLLSSSELQQIKRLKKQIIYQQTAGVFNNVSATASQLVSGNTASLGELGVNSGYSLLRPREITEREKKVNFLSAKALQQNNALTPTVRTGLEKNVQRLTLKRQISEIKGNVNRADFYYQKGDFNAAEFYLQQASFLNDSLAGSKAKNSKLRQLKKWRWRLAEAEGQQQRRWLADSIAASDARPDTLQAELLAVLLSSDPAAHAAARDRFRQGADRNGISSLLFCDAAWSLSLGKWQEGKAELYRLARQHAEKQTASLARGLLQSYSLNPYRKFLDLKSAYQAEVRRYILTGQQPANEQAYLASSVVARNASNATSNLGVFFIFHVLVRGVKTLITTPVDVSAVKAAGAEYVRFAATRENTAPYIRDVSAWLASVSERQGQFAAARKYYELAGILTPDRDRKLSEKASRELLRLALTEKNFATKKLVLTSIIENYPDTSSLKKAQTELTKASQEENTMCRLDYKTLTDNPLLIEALAILPQLLDGRKANGEISRQGITVMKTGLLRFTDSNTGMELSLTLDQKQFKQFSELWNQLHSETQRAEAESQALVSRKFPVEITGSLGASGVDAYPSLQPLPDDQTLNLFK